MENENKLSRKQKKSKKRAPFICYFYTDNGTLILRILFGSKSEVRPGQSCSYF